MTLEKILSRLTFWRRYHGQLSSIILCICPRPVWAWSARAAAKSRTGSKAISDHSEDLMSRLDSLKQMGCFSTLNSTLVSGQERPYPKAFKTASFRTQSLKKGRYFFWARQGLKRIKFSSCKKPLGDAFHITLRILIFDIHANGHIQSESINSPVMGMGEVEL